MLNPMFIRTPISQYPGAFVHGSPRLHCSNHAVNQPVWDYAFKVLNNQPNAKALGGHKINMT